jgi:hypothetical protein
MLPTPARIRACGALSGLEAMPCTRFDRGTCKDAEKKVRDSCSE